MSPGQAQHIPAGFLQQRHRLNLRHRLNCQEQLAAGPLDEPHRRSWPSDGSHTGALKPGEGASDIEIRAHGRGHSTEKDRNRLLDLMDLMDLIPNSL
jgi:hypothetical protein